MMKRLLIILLGVLPLFAPAQNLSAAQKQEALSTATKFCNLLTRFCDGERTLTTEINALCSGADCSAFDDVKSNKEVTLRNYLMAIQKNYPTKLATEITAPSLSDSQVFVEPIISLSQEWGSVTDSEIGTTVLTSVDIEGTNDYFVVFNVTQKYPTLGKSIQKKIVYSVNSKKVTAFITNQGSYMSFLEGTAAYANKEYAKAAKLYEAAATNDSADRGSLKKKCYIMAAASYTMADNWGKAAECAGKSGDKFYSALLHFTDRCNVEDWDNAYKYALMLEDEMAKRSDLEAFVLASNYMSLASFYLNPLAGSYHDNKKALRLVKKADALDFPAVGHMLFVCCLCDLFSEDDITFDEIRRSLYKSARLGYPPSLFWVGSMEENDGNTASAISWFEKSANAGNPVAMARLGRLLNKAGKQESARKWLKKALEGQALETQLEDYAATTGKPDWPKGRSDVQSLLNSTASSSSNTSSSTSNNYSNTQSTSNGYSSSYSSYPSSYSHPSSHRRKGKFNEPKDNAAGGISFGYVRKRWVYDYGDKKIKYGVFEDKDYISGFQAGFRANPQYGYGFSLNTGLYYEYYSMKSPEYHDEEGAYHAIAKEHCLYVPIHFKYDLNFSKWFQLAFYGGVGLDYGISGKIKLRADGKTFDSFSMYDDEFDMKRFNTSLEYGAAIRFRHIQFDISTSKGLLNMSRSDEYKVKQDKFLNISITILGFDD